MLKFTFATASQILFGYGVFEEAIHSAIRYGARPFVVCRANDAFMSFILDALSLYFDEIVLFPVQGEPDIELITTGLAAAREGNCDFIIGVGGGSVIDTGKAIAALLTNGGEILDYLEIIGRGKKLDRKSVPYIAIPTTAGTGSEVTKNAVIRSIKHRQKASLRSPYLLPDLAVVDPEFTLSVPPEATASTGMDALTQVIEPILSKKANPMTDSLCFEAIRWSTECLVDVYRNGTDRVGRERLAYTSLVGGLALANSGLGAVHGFAAPIGGMYPIEHGKICACLLPIIFEANWEKIHTGAAQSEFVNRMQKVAAAIHGVERQECEKAIQWLYDLKAKLNIPSLGEMGVKITDADLIAEKAAASSSMQGNPVVFSHEELVEIIVKAIRGD